MLRTKPNFKFLFCGVLVILLLVSCAPEPVKTNVVVDPLAGVTDPEQIRVIRLQMFGPDPYVSKAPVVPERAKKDFDAAMEKLKAKDEAGAEAGLKALIKAYPTLSGPAYNLSVLKFNKGKSKAAKKYVKIAIERNTYNLNARNFYAYLLRNEGDFAAAEKEYLEIIKMWGGYLPAYKNLGILYDNLYMGKPEKALPQYKNYNSLLAKPDKQVAGWILVLERELKPKQPVPPPPPVEELAPPVVDGTAANAEVPAETEADAIPQQDATQQVPAIVEEGQ